jgi:hypothetical protein
MRYRTYGFLKIRGISWLVEDLSSSQEGLSCMKLFSLVQIATFANSIIYGRLQEKSDTYILIKGCILSNSGNSAARTSAISKWRRTQSKQEEEMEGSNINTSKTT